MKRAAPVSWVDSVPDRPASSKPKAAIAIQPPKTIQPKRPPIPLPESLRARLSLPDDEEREQEEGALPVDADVGSSWAEKMLGRHKS